MSEMRKYKNERWYECRPARKGVYYIFWTENGRSKRHSTSEKETAPAQAYFDQWLDLEGAPVPGSNLTCEDLFRIRYPDMQNLRADAAWKNLGPHFGALRPADVTQAVEDRYKASCTRAPSTLRAELSMLRASWNLAVEKKLLAFEDKPRLDPLPPASPPRDRWLTKDETDALLAAAKAHARRPYLFLVLALETAARRNAICELQWGKQVDWETGVIDYLRPGTRQTRKRRAAVPMSKTLRPILREAFETRDPSDPYVIGEGGRINEMIRRVAVKAGVSGVSPHVLRHTAATRMARHGVPLWSISKVLGNTMDQVEKTYAKHQPEMFQGAVDLISGG